MMIVHGGEKAYMLEKVNDFSHVNKLGSGNCRPEYDGTFFWGKIKKKKRKKKKKKERTFGNKKSVISFMWFPFLLLVSFQFVCPVWKFNFFKKTLFIVLSAL